MNFFHAHDVAFILIVCRSVTDKVFDDVDLNWLFLNHLKTGTIIVRKYSGTNVLFVLFSCLAQCWVTSFFFLNTLCKTFSRRTSALTSHVTTVHFSHKAALKPVCDKCSRLPDELCWVVHVCDFVWTGSLFHANHYNED